MAENQRFLEKIAPANAAGCWLWVAHANACGYGTFKVGGRSVLAHRFAWAMANGPIPEGLCALHRCDVPACVNPSHLFLGTQLDNIADRAAKGRGADQRGSRHVNAKLTEAEAVEIFHASGLHKDIGARYGVHFSRVSRIKRGENWAHATAGMQ